MIYRIQNLLPGICGICKETYTVNKSDPHLLACSVCQQEVHHKCWAHLLQKKNLVDGFFSTLGLHFLCLSCKQVHIPERNAGLKKQKRTASVSNSEDHSKTENAAFKPLQPIPSLPPATPPCPRQSPMAARAPTPEIKMKHDDEFQVVPKKICHH